MRLSDAFNGVHRLFLDSPPVIYFVEKNPAYAAVLTEIFSWISAGQITAVTGPITLAESLVLPYRLALGSLQQDFLDLIVHGSNTVFVSVDQDDGRYAGELRAAYNLTLPDALQIASAIRAGCDAVLTNDTGLRRVKETFVIVIDDLEL